MEIEGTVKLIGETESVGSNGFRKRDVVITTNEQYPQHISIQFVQDKCDLLNNFNVGHFCKIGINLRGREWVSPQGETKYFNTIQGWRIDVIQVNTQPQSQSAVTKYNESKKDPYPEPFTNEAEKDDLPY